MCLCTCMWLYVYVPVCMCVQHVGVCANMCMCVCAHFKKPLKFLFKSLSLDGSLFYFSLFACFGLNFFCLFVYWQSLPGNWISTIMLGCMTSRPKKSLFLSPWEHWDYKFLKRLCKISIFPGFRQFIFY